MEVGKFASNEFCSKSGELCARASKTEKVPITSHGRPGLFVLQLRMNN